MRKPSLPGSSCVASGNPDLTYRLSMPLLRRILSGQLWWQMFAVGCGGPSGPVGVGCAVGVGVGLPCGVGVGVGPCGVGVGVGTTGVGVGAIGVGHGGSTFGWHWMSACDEPSTTSATPAALRCSALTVKSPVLPA